MPKDKALKKRINLPLSIRRKSMKNRMKHARAFAAEKKSNQLCSTFPAQMTVDHEEVVVDLTNLEIPEQQNIVTTEEIIAENCFMDINEEENTVAIIDESGECLPANSFMDEENNEVVMRETPIKNNVDVIDGRRIINVKHLFSQICNAEKHEPFDCTIADMIVIKEQRFGLRSKFTLQCQMCQIIKIIDTEEPTQESMNINQAAAFGAISTGIGYSQCDEFLSTMNIPFMSSGTYLEKQQEISTLLHDTVLSVIIEAGKEEYKLAEELGDVDEDGIGNITVIADGAWSKRSYNVNYNASSGVACIIGERTGKILFLGVRNKYCSICAYNESKNVSKEHICFKNWTGASTAMESDIIVEGFKQSIEMHRLRYIRLVGDGDSSVSYKLIQAKPYGNLRVEKVECRNHLYRNCFHRLRKLDERTASKFNSKKIPKNLRKHVVNSVTRIIKDIKVAVKYRNNEETELNTKISALQEDIKNVPSHVFGEHKNCVQIGYFKCEPQDDELNYVPSMTECGLYNDILAELHRLIHNASSLLLDMTNNDAERYNSVLCKFVGGKRINFTTRNSYNMRCEAAAISFNSKGTYHTVVNEAFSGKPNTTPYYTSKYVNKIGRKRLANRKSKRKYKTPNKRNVGPDDDYGLVPSPQPSLATEQLEIEKNKFIENLQLTSEQIIDLEKATRGQSDNHEWKQQRSLRLTASNFGTVCKMKATTDPAKTVTSFIDKPFKGNAGGEHRAALGRRDQLGGRWQQRHDAQQRRHNAKWQRFILIFLNFYQKIIK